MTEKEKAAQAGARTAKENNTTSIGCDSIVARGQSPAHKITVLETVGPHLTKRFLADGTVEAYDDAASFKVKEVAVTSFDELSRLLAKIHDNPKRCIIRGTPKPRDQMTPAKVEGTYVRQLVNYNDEPKHFCLIDIDGYKPGFADPVLEPELAILDFIDEKLPWFKGCSFHWQLSSSAGTAKAKGVLKAHVWFWLATPYTSAQLTVWAKRVVGPAIDAAVFRTVQVHYTANPLFEEGVTDPVPVRHGVWRGKADAVPLQLDGSVLDLAREATSADGAGMDHKLVDPGQKEGLVGLFHRTFDAERVLSEFLEGEFEQVTERRWTWLNGGGTPEGVWVHDDGMHVGSSHNTWPIDGIANLWDLVRVFKFGHLDVVETEDEFEKFDAENTAIQSKPSQIAMLDWASQLDEIKEARRQELDGAVDQCLAAIAAAKDYRELETTVAAAIRETTDLSENDRGRVENAFVERNRELTGGTRGPNGQLRGGNKLSAAWIKIHLRPPRHVTTTRDAPEWAKRWVWVRELDQFMNVETKMCISERSYNASYDRYMQPNADGLTPRASSVALTDWRTQVVDIPVYLPSADLFFWMDGHYCINLYRDNLAPAIPSEYSDADLAAIKIVEDHVELMIPDARERRLFLDFLAYNVQRPGSKIRWAVLLKGIPGDGKTAFSTLLSHCMGHPNVRSLSSSTLEGSNFSAWGAGQCVVAIEEVKIQGANRYDVFNKLKPYITNDVVEIHPKGKDPRNVPNTSNYILFSNFNDALPLDDNDRRIMPLWSPFAKKEQLFGKIKERFGMDQGDYFDRLFDKAIKQHAGALRKWLMEREFSPEFRADGRAPETSVRGIMVDISKADDVIAAEECLRIGGLGIYESIVSVTHLAEMLQGRGVEVRTRRVSTIMQDLGFSPVKRFHWRNKDVTVYVKEPYSRDCATAEIRLEMDRLEATRTEKLIEEDFQD